MYSSTTATQASSRQGGYTKGYAPQVPQGFTVRVLKGPSVYSFPQTTSSHFDRGYQSIPLSEPRTSSSNINWYTRSQTTTLTPSESQKTSRPPTSSGTSLPNDPRLLTCDPSSRSKPFSYSIYQSTNDTFIYEASLSSKADLSSNSEDEDYTPAYSPATSTDSITTVRGANTPDASVTDLRTSTTAPASTSSSSRIPFPLNIPSLAQAQNVIKGIFRGQAQNDSQSTANTSISAGSGTSVRPSVSRASETASRSGDRASGISQQHNEYALSSDNAHKLGSRSPVSDDEDTEVDPIAKANAEYNAAVSKVGSSVPYYSSARDSAHTSVANSTATGAGVRSATGPLHPNLSTRTVPEQYRTQAMTPHVQPSYWGAAEMTRPHNMANGHNSHFPSGDPVASTAQIPLSQRSGPSSRYVPASHTMTPGPTSTSPEPTANRERHEHTTYVPPSVARERKTSLSRVSPITTSQAAVHREGGGASASRSVPSANESRRGYVERQAPYASYRADPPASQEPSTFLVSHPSYNTPFTHHATTTIQSNHEVAPDANPWYTATATQHSGSVTSHTSDHRTSPEQAYIHPSQQPIPQPRNYTTAPPSGERASDYSTRGTNISPPRTRHDSTAAYTNGLSTRSSNVEASTAPTPAQDRPQQDMRTRQDFIYEAQNSRIDDARNPRGRDYSSRHEADRTMVDTYSRTSERQASHFSNAYPQRGSAPATALSPVSSASGHSETPAVPDPLQIPFPAPATKEPQRRYSDGDTCVASQSTYGPAYASTSGTNVLPAVTGTAAEASRTTEPQSQRRYSDGESNFPDQVSLTLLRTVRWNENLICPSPIFPHQRRKGWFNRRGDQLWTNVGAYKPPEQGQEYPSDLDTYPEHGEGWMNEQGVRIDMAHRLIPKVPLKSALKTSRPPPATAQQEN